MKDHREPTASQHPSQPGPADGSADTDARSLLHRLKVHQVELEQQNAELARGAHADAAANLQRYTELYDFAPIAYFTLDTRGVIQQLNFAAAELLGQHRSDAVGRPIRAFVAEASHPTLVALLAKVFGAEKSANGELALQGKEGQRRTVDLLVSAEASGSTCLVAAFDVTERRVAENKLRRSEAHLRLSQHYGGIGTWEYDPATGAQCWSDAAIALLGLPIQAIPIFERYLALIHPDERQTVADAVQSTLDHDTRLDVEYRITANGVTRRVRSAGQAERDGHGRVLRLRGIIQDITERKEAVVNLERYRLHLEELVAERTLELEAAKRAAETANRTKSRFLANMSHEIRTPLNAIVGLAYLLRKRVADPHGLEQLNKLTDSAQHLLSILNGILDLSKIEADKLVIEKIDLDLEAVFMKVYGQFCGPVAAKGLEIVFDIDPALTGPLRGDALRLSQVLLNLVGNAVKFTDSGSVLLSASADHPRDDEVTARFEVLDTGIGIDAAQRERLFEAFEQADSSTTRRYGGTGLGLAISLRLVQLMGGEMGVDSQPGEGSRFWFTLPLERKGEGAFPATHALLDGRRALVADDSPQARAVIAKMLRGLGLRVETAGSGPQALATIEQEDRRGEPFELIVIDEQMPHLSGLETGRCLKSLPLRRPPPYRWVTSFGEQLTVAEAEQAGYQVVLRKPLTPGPLHVAVSRMGGAPGAALATDDAAPRVTPGAGRHGARVLLADDDPISREVVQALLSDAGFEVGLAVNGLEALSMAQRTRYDLILMDVQMPDMDGLAATRAIRRTPGLETTPILAMTANVYAEDREECLAAGMNDHVGKPVMPDVLLNKLRQWLPAQGE